MGFKIISGKMGGGKSYWGCEIAHQAWAQNAIVHSNLAFKPEALAPLIQPDQYVELGDDITTWKGKIRAGAEGFENVVVVDEGAIMFNAQDFSQAKGQKREVFEFMVHARKLGLDVYFISQHAKNIDAQLRRMAENEYQCVATKRIPGIGPLLVPIFGQFRRYICSPDGREVYESHWAKLKPEIADTYRTDAMHGKNLGIERDVRRTASTDRKMTPFLWKVLVVLALVLLVGTRAIASIMAVFEKEVPAAPAIVPLKPIIPAERSEAVTPPKAKPEEVAKPEWFIRSGQGRDHLGRRYVDVRGHGMVFVGSIFQDCEVLAILDQGEVVELHTPGKNFRTRRPCKSDVIPTSESTKPWKLKSPSSLRLASPPLSPAL